MWSSIIAHRQCRVSSQSVRQRQTILTPTINQNSIKMRNASGNPRSRFRAELRSHFRYTTFGSKVDYETRFGPSRLRDLRIYFTAHRACFKVHATVCYGRFTPPDATRYKKLSYRRVTARCVLSVVILPTATQQCRNYLYDKS